MAIETHAAARFSPEHLVALTNPDNREATTIDTVREASAVADATADFLVYAKTAYDDADAIHIKIAVRGFVAYLMSWGGAASGIATTTVEAFRDELREIRARVTPSTESKLEPTDEFKDRVLVRPDFDRDHFGQVEVEAPRVRTTQRSGETP